MPGCTEPGVGTAAKAQIPIENNYRASGESLLDKCGASIGRSVVDHDDFAPRNAFRGDDHGRKILLKKGTAVPVGNDDRSGSHLRLNFWVPFRARRQAGKEIDEGY